MDGSQNHYHHYHHHRCHYQQQQQLQDQFVDSSTSTCPVYSLSSFVATLPPPSDDGGSSSSTTIGGSFNCITWTPNHLLNAAAGNINLNANGVLSNSGDFREIPLVPDDPSLLINSSTPTCSMIQQHRQADSGRDDHHSSSPWVNSNNLCMSSSFCSNHQYYNSADHEEQYGLAEIFKKQLPDMSNIKSLESQFHSLPFTTTNYNIIRLENHQQQADFSTVHGHITDDNDDDELKKLSIKKGFIRQISIPSTNCISNLQNDDDHHLPTAASLMSLLSTLSLSTDFQGLDFLMSSRMNLGDDHQPAASPNTDNFDRVLFEDALSLDHRLQSLCTDPWLCNDALSLEHRLQSSSTDPWPSNRHNQMMSSLMNGVMIERNRSSSSQRINVLKGTAWNSSTLKEGNISSSSKRVNVLMGTAWNSSTLREGSLDDHQHQHTRKAALVAKQTNKKPRTEYYYSSVPSKQVKEEKEKIATLQQMVAPFSKSDKATVLNETICYIKSMEHQIETLSLPALPCMKSVVHTPIRPTLQQGTRKDGGSQEPKHDLKSRGLCVAPLSFTSYIHNDSFALGCVWPPFPNTGFCRSGP